MIVANNVAQPGAGFDRDTNIVTFIKPDGSMEKFDQMQKTQVADLILDRVIEMINAKN